MCATVAPVLVLVGLSTLAPRPVLAHAVLTATEPAAASTVPAAAAPTRIQLVFNERVEPGFNSVRVVGADGRRHDLGPAQLLGDAMVVEVPIGPLPAGAYTVAWQVNSIDGHQIRGYFGFGVDAAPPDESVMVLAGAVRQTTTWRIWVLVVNALTLVAVSLWLGGLGFMALPDAATAVHALQAGPRLRCLTDGSGAAFLGLSVVAFMNQAATLADSSLLGALAPSVSVTAVTTTNFGRWWAIRFGTSAVLLVLGHRSTSHALRSGRGFDAMRAVAGGVLAGLVLVTWPLTGHAGAVRGMQAAAVAADWLHLAAAVLWIGGVVSLAIVVSCLDPAVPERRRVVERVLARFSSAALAAVALLVVSGSYSTWQHVSSVSLIATTDYGRALLTKVALFTVVLALAWANRRTVARLGVPVAETGTPHDWTRGLRRRLAAEASLLMAVLGVVAWLTSLPPASVAATPGTFSERRVMRDVAVTFQLRPNRLGKNDLTIALRRAADGAPVTARAVSVFLKTLDVDTGLVSIEAMVMAPGDFHAELIVPAAGRALVSLQVTPEQGDAFVVEFEAYVAG